MDGRPPNRTEYLWLDDFCLSDAQRRAEDSDIQCEREEELGRMADIFRNAWHVVVFCHEINCDHTTLSCGWGKRLFTLPEILHAREVVQMTVTKVVGTSVTTELTPIPARTFREGLQTNAAREKRWHLYAIFQHGSNAGSVPWQLAIQALVVEAILRDESGGFDDHKYLGKALNGLLPRKARLPDFRGEGWTDLAWLLEVNQGFYNAASLAAVCSIGDKENQPVSWLGAPIHPEAGNERLEPLVTAFPISASSCEAGEPNNRLAVVGEKTVGLRPALKRDIDGLYNNEEMKGLKISLYAMSTTFLIVAVLIVLYSPDYRAWQFAGSLFYVTAILHAMVELLTGTMYLERTGWIYLAESDWTANPGERLSEIDYKLGKLTEWGEH
ncbi:hypothetical protein C8R45DRAFT_824530 [Mycena sanguinolenta]|nr:hypothetical protein C8R45DRAFT_824530 [Mycena sanguinolenta]